jgi:hypothetical protein
MFNVGFEVANIDATVIRLKFDVKDNLTWDPLRYRMASKIKLDFRSRNSCKVY